MNVWTTTETLFRARENVESKRCSQYTGNCVECGSTTGWIERIFCMNYCWWVGGFPPRHGSWCAKCYKSTSNTSLTSFYKKEKDQEQVDPAYPDDTNFEVACPGSHLLVPFQCEKCAFRRIQKR